MLSRPDIEDEIRAGNIIISPFDINRLDSNGYDISLGEWFYRRHPTGIMKAVFNPFSQEDVRKVWGEPQRAMPANLAMKEYGGADLTGINDNDLVILAYPGDMLLCHSLEFIGGRKTICSRMEGKSGWRRNFISVCMEAALGGVGYFNRWTMEIMNTNPDYAVPLPVGTPMAKIVFFRVREVKDTDHYEQRGTYQSSSDLNQVMKSWSPENMLPKLYDKRKKRKAEEEREIQLPLVLT